MMIAGITRPTKSTASTGEVTRQRDTAPGARQRPFARSCYTGTLYANRIACARIPVIRLKR
jgi:hypothetical protein